MGFEGRQRKEKNRNVLGARVGVHIECIAGAGVGKRGRINCTCGGCSENLLCRQDRKM